MNECRYCLGKQIDGTVNETPCCIPCMTALGLNMAGSYKALFKRDLLFIGRSLLRIFNLY